MKKNIFLSMIAVLFIAGCNGESGTSSPAASAANDNAPVQVAEGGNDNGPLMPGSGKSDTDNGANADESADQIDTGDTGSDNGHEDTSNISGNDNAPG